MTRTSPRRLAAVFLAISSTAALACGGAVDDKIDTRPFDQAVCQAGMYPRAAMDLRPGSAVDVVQMRTRDYGATSSRVVAQTGEACKTAKDRATCLDAFAAMVPAMRKRVHDRRVRRASTFACALAACVGSVRCASTHDVEDHPADSGATAFHLGPMGDMAPVDYWVVTTKGDDVRGYGTAAEVRTLLAPIDTPDEAALVMASQVTSQWIDCSATNSVHASKDGGYDVLTRSGSGCGDDIERHVVHVAVGGSTTVTATETVKKGDPNCAIGRRPAGLVAATSPMREGLGALFARIARLEAASVPAFERLERELRSYGAPSSLLAGCRRAARDEVRHARAMTVLAQRHGAKPELPVLVPIHARNLEAIALENAVEGCVRETYGALVATHQAMNATDRRIARVMRGIARDETRHAALSWAIDAWVRTQLDAGAIARIDAARTEAMHGLEAELACEGPIDEEHVRAGFPAPDVARAMFAGLAAEIVEPRAA